LFVEADLSRQRWAVVVVGGGAFGLFVGAFEFL
jgi:hypothetical protein